MMETMRKFALWCCSLCLTGVLYAQGNDPVVMKINGKDVPRSEFEYNFNKNNGENVVDKKTVDEYVDLFVNYKLKVEAALDARYDTLSSFKKEFRTYRDQQIRPYFVSVSAEEKEFGKEFCDLIRQHCEEYEIERPEDLRVRTVANKSKLKVSIIQSIDRKVALDDIASAKGIDFNELLDEIEAIVYSGTKLNIDYFLDEAMDEDHLLDIYDYFKESETDSLAVAMDELGDDYTEEEVRLVRIKFISEMAN